MYRVLLYRQQNYRITYNNNDKRFHNELQSNFNGILSLEEFTIEYKIFNDDKVDGQIDTQMY